VRGVAAALAAAFIGVEAGVCLAADAGAPGDAGVPLDAGAAEAPPTVAPTPARAAPPEAVSPPVPAPPEPTPPLPPSSGEVVVQAPAPPRSASDARIERPVLEAAPHRTAADLLFTVPGAFVTQHSGEGKAYQIFYRGFDAVHGQDLEVWAGGAPVNDVSNVHGQGYADLQFIPVETVQRIAALPGTYDPRQGDFAVAGTLRFELGYDRPGFTAKATAGSFGTRRAFLAYRPTSADERTFAAAELYETDGFGPARAATRAAAVGQTVVRLGDGTSLRVMASAYTGRFSSAGVLRLSDVESGAVSRFATYDASQGGANGRAQVVTELVHRNGSDGEVRLSTFLVQRSLLLRQNFTGFLADLNGDAQQQINDAFVLGAVGSYRRRVPLVSPRDAIEIGFYGRSDWIEQSQRRLAAADDRVTATEVEARVRARDVAGYADLSLFPLERLVLRGGVRIDGLGYMTQDFGGAAAGQARAAQGTHVGKKATIDVRLGRGLSAVASYGEGFRSPQARSLADGQTAPFTDVVSGEVGVRYGGPMLRASAAGFVTALSEDLVFDHATARNERVPATRRIGGALDLVGAPLPWLVASASGTFTHAAFTASGPLYQAGDLLPYVPQLIARADVAATPVLGVWRGHELRARAGAGASLLARRPLPYREMGDDVFLLDATVGAGLGPIEARVDAFNLLDAAWYDGQFVYASRWDQNAAPSLVPQRHVTVGAPRTVLFTLAVYL
jgi:outer membrane cobalamin receptor